MTPPCLDKGTRLGPITLNQDTQLLAGVSIELADGRINGKRIKKGMIWNERIK
jgi:hypothetical protein